MHDSLLFICGIGCTNKINLQEIVDRHGSDEDCSRERTQIAIIANASDQCVVEEGR